MKGQKEELVSCNNYNYWKNLKQSHPIHSYDFPDGGNYYAINAFKGILKWQCNQSSHIGDKACFTHQIKYQNNIGDALFFTKSNNLEKMKKDPHIWRILYRGELNRFIEACNSINRRLMNYVMNTQNNGVCRIHGNEISFSDHMIAEATRLPNIASLFLIELVLEGGTRFAKF